MAQAMKPRDWFLPDPHAARLICVSCPAPAAGFDSMASPRCCGDCARKDCKCAFHARQREIVREMPVKSRRATA